MEWAISLISSCLPFVMDFEFKRPMHQRNTCMDRLWEALNTNLGTGLMMTQGQFQIHLAWQKLAIFTNWPVEPNAWQQLTTRMQEAKITNIIDAGSARGFFSAALAHHSRLPVLAYDTVRQPLPLLPVSSPSSSEQLLALLLSPRSAALTTSIYGPRPAFIRVYKVSSLAKQQTILAAPQARQALLLLLWPPADCTMAYDTLTAFVGHYVVFADPLRDADDGFYALLRTEWTKLASWPILASLSHSQSIALFRRNS